MILFVNVKITSDFLTYYERGLLPSAERAQVFRYAMASLAVIPWSAVRLYIEFDQTQIHHRDEVLEHIRQIFPAAQLSTTRLKYQKDWQPAIEELDELDDELVWYLCNDDHVFIDTNLDTVLGIEQHMLRLMEANPYVGCPFSHWPEQVAAFSRINYRMEEGHMVAPYASPDSVQIVTKDILRHWWFSADYGNEVMVRSDWGPIVKTDYPQPGLGVLPLRELVRHFDGYSHVGIDGNICPPLFIPPRFFDNDVRLRYGGMPQAGTVLVDPLNPNSSAVHGAGADLQITLDELPLFWRSAIAETAVARDPVAKDALAAVAARYKVAAAGMQSDTGVYAVAKLMGQAALPQPFSLIDLCRIQATMNRSRVQKMLLKGCEVKRSTPFCQSPALTIVVEDHLSALAHGTKMPDFASAQNAGAEFVWLGTLNPETWRSLMNMTYRADTVCHMRQAPYEVWLDSILEYARADILLWLPAGHAPTEEDSLNWAAALSSKTCESIASAVLSDCDLVILVKENGEPELDIGASLLGIVTRRHVAQRLLSGASGDASTRSWEHLLVRGESDLTRVKVLAMA